MNGRSAALAFAIALSTACVLAAAPSVSAADDARVIAYGRHLAQQCTACHRIDGTSNGIPAIVGWPVEQLVAVLGAYKRGERSNAAMVSITQTLGTEEMTALASYFGALKSVAPKKR